MKKGVKDSILVLELFRFSEKLLDSQKLKSLWEEQPTGSGSVLFKKREKEINLRFYSRDFQNFYISFHVFVG